MGEFKGKRSKKSSKIMSKIRRKDTKPELALRKALHALGCRFRVDVKDLPGRPDIAIKKYRIAVFIDGEFWHGKNWEEKKKRIKKNREYWINKIELNMARDRKNDKELNNLGYEVHRYWAGEVLKNYEQIAEDLFKGIQNKNEQNRLASPESKNQLPYNLILTKA